MKKHDHVLRADAALQARLGAIVRACRRQLGITQLELATRAHLHRTYVADVERGKRNVTVRSIANLARSLEITVAHLFMRATSPTESVALDGPKPAADEVRDILLVEHNRAAAAAVARAFRRARLRNPLRIVSNGEAGLDYLFGTGPYAVLKPEPPQLILLVFDLPKMTGEEFLRRVRNDVRTRGIPVVVLKVTKMGRPLGLR